MCVCILYTQFFTMKNNNLLVLFILCVLCVDINSEETRFYMNYV